MLPGDPMHVRVCRDCGEEYRPEIAVCADCGGELQDHYGEAPRSGRAIPPGGTEGGAGEEEEETIAYASHPAHLTALADELARAGVPFRLAERADLRQFGLLVPAGSAAQARSVLDPRLTGDDPDRLYTPTRSGEPLSDAEVDAVSPLRCPACDAALPERPEECPACGLSVGWEPEREG